MELIETEAKAPPHGIVSPVVASRSVVLRTARWPPAQAAAPDGEARGTVVICTGRSEFIEKYYEVIEDLRRRGFSVAIFDWRGQGFSARQLRNRVRGHIWTFDEFEQDIEAVRQQVLEPFCPRPWFALAHSMSGPIILNFAAHHPDVFQRLVLSAPMIDIARLPRPALARVLARWACRLGFRRHQIPIGRNRALFLSTFDGNVLTSDRVRFERTASLLRAEPGLGLGPPTYGWMHAAFECIAALAAERFIESFVTPTLIVMPGSDVVVDGRAAERLASRLRTCTLVTVFGAKHEVLMERDSLRQQFWSAFDAFIPGSERPRGATRDCVPASGDDAPLPIAGTGAARPGLSYKRVEQSHARSDQATG